MSAKQQNEIDAIGPVRDEKNATTAHFEGTETIDDLKCERKIGGIVIGSHMTAEERSTAMRLANELDPGPDMFRWRYILFLLTCLVVILNSGDSGMSLNNADLILTSSGYDPTIMSSVNSMTQFHDYLGLRQASASTGVVFVVCELLGEAPVNEVESSKASILSAPFAPLP